MASSTFLTIPTAFPARSSLLSGQSLSPSGSPFSVVSRALPGRRRGPLRVNAVALKWEPTKVVPQADRVLVRLEQLPEKSAGGVLLPKSAVKFERYLMGEIVSAGADVQEVGAGKKVLFSDISAYEVELSTDGKHCFVKAGDLLAVVE